MAAECMRTSRTVSFMGAQYLGLVEQLVEGRVKQARAKVCRLNRRQTRGRRKLDSADTAVLYALRPTHPDIWFLSPYEFTMYWDIVPTRVPQTREEAEDPTAQWDVTLQPCGLDKLRAASDGRNDLLPGVDYACACVSWQNDCIRRRSRMQPAATLVAAAATSAKRVSTFRVLSNATSTRGTPRGERTRHGCVLSSVDTARSCCRAARTSGQPIA